MSHIMLKSTEYGRDTDHSGFIVVTEDQWDEMKKKAEAYFEFVGGSVEVNIGTNETIDYDSYKNWLDATTEHPLSTAELKVISSLFPIQNGYDHISFGNFVPESLFFVMDDDEDYQESLDDSDVDVDSSYDDDLYEE